MIFFVSTILWLVSLWLLHRVWQSFSQNNTTTPVGKIILSLLLFCSVPLLFRPHEDIYGGQDPGSYLNSGVSYARNQSLFYEDELLAKVQTESRPAFFYGHRGFRQTKDACLWIKDLDSATVGPWFQPAYPILMSLFPSLKFTRGILYVAPLFTLFTALALAALATQLFKHRWAGAAAFLFYILNPNTIWHGRCPRPEMIAGFLVIAGFVLLLDLLNNNSNRRITDTTLMATALTSAPFFHITSLFAAIPTGIFITISIFTGHKILILSIPFFITGFFLFVFQTINITDCYGILSSIAPFLNIAYIAAGILLAVTIIASLILIIRHPDELIVKSNSLENLRKKPALWIMLTSCILMTGTILMAYYKLPNGGRFNNVPILHYFMITDIRGVITLMSRPLSLLALIGWISLFFRRGTTPLSRAILLASMFPAVIGVGNMPHFMYFSRRIQPFLIPMLALSLTSLVTLIPARRNIFMKIIFIAVTTSMLALGIRNRTELFTLTENRGLTSFLSRFSDEIKRNNGILLSEYSRIAAPMDHYFGIPTLGLDSDRRGDYSEAESAWAQIMKHHAAGRPAYFMTPFQPPVSELFDFTPVMQDKLEYKQLRSFGRLPIPIGGGSLTLSLYKMQLSDQKNHEQQFPYIKSFGHSSMGFRNFAATRSRTWNIKSVHCKANNTTIISLLANAQPSWADRWRSPRKQLLAFFHSSDKNPDKPDLHIKKTKTSDRTEWINLGDNWWLFKTTIKNGTMKSLSITPANDLFLSDLCIADRSGSSTSFSQEEFTKNTLAQFPASMDARWTRSDAGVLLPKPSKGTGFVLLYAKTSDAGQTLTLSSKHAKSTAAFKDPATEWRWFVYPIVLADDTKSNTIWVNITASPPWDPKLERWPNDLGILIGKIIVLE